MANVRPDWSWMPDSQTHKGWHNWAASVRRRRFEAEEQLINFNVQQVRRIQLTKRQIAATQAIQREVRTYYDRRQQEGWRFNQQVMKNEVQNGEYDNAPASRAGGKSGGEVSTIRRRGKALDSRGKAAKRRGSHDLRGARVTRHPSGTGDASCHPELHGGVSMSTTTLVILDGVKTRPWRRYADLELACQAADHEQEIKDAPDHMIVHAGTVMGSLEAEELEALFKATGEKAELTQPQQLVTVKKWLLEFGEEHDALSTTAQERVQSENKERGVKPKANGVGGKTKPATTTVRKSLATKAKKKSWQELRNEVREVVKSTKVQPNIAKGKTPKTRVKSGDGLGRPNTMGRYVNELILKGGMSDEDIVKKTQTQFPEHTIRDYYPNWYRARLRKAGLLKEVKK